MLKQGHVRIGEAELKILAVVEVTVGRIGGWFHTSYCANAMRFPGNQRMAGARIQKLTSVALLPERALFSPGFSTESFTWMPGAKPGALASASGCTISDSRRPFAGRAGLRGARLRRRSRAG